MRASRCDSCRRGCTSPAQHLRPRSSPLMNNRVAVITGAAQGIGRRTAELLAELGYRIGLIDLREPAATIEAIQSRGGHVVSYTGDITNEGAVLDFAALV